jgi:hypothetical protein
MYPPVELLKPNYYTIHVPGAEIRPEKRSIFLVHTPKELKTTIRMTANLQDVPGTN